MFWSPAVATLSVCCAAAGHARAVAARAAASVLRMSSSLVFGAWEQVQLRHRQAQTDWGIDVEVALVRYGEVTVSDRDAIAIMSTRIGPVRNPSRQHDGAWEARVGVVELRDVVAEIGGHRTDGRGAAPQDRRLGPGPDRDARDSRRNLEIERVLRPHEARDEGRVRPIVDLLRRAGLRDPPGIHHDDPIGHRHRLLAIVRDVDRGEAEAILERLDLLAQLHAHLGVEVRQRLVEEEELRVDGERAPERHALALAAGEVRDLALLEAREVEELQHLADPPPHLGPG